MRAAVDQFPGIDSPNDYIPSDTERRWLKRELEEAQSHQQAFEDEVERLKLEHQQRTAHIQVRNLAIMLAPHKRLPPEILARIFVAARPSCPDDYISIPPPPDIKATGLKFPWTLAAVCSHWHQVVLKEPQV